MEGGVDFDSEVVMGMVLRLRRGLGLSSGQQQ